MKTPAAPQGRGPPPDGGGRLGGWGTARRLRSNAQSGRVFRVPSAKTITATRRRGAPHCGPFRWQIDPPPVREQHIARENLKLTLGIGLALDDVPRSERQTFGQTRASGHDTLPVGQLRHINVRRAARFQVVPAYPTYPQSRPGCHAIGCRPARASKDLADTPFGCMAGIVPDMGHEAGAPNPPLSRADMIGKRPP
jgi:hypothetical protein